MITQMTGRAHIPTPLQYGGTSAMQAHLHPSLRACLTLKPMPEEIASRISICERIPSCMLP